jgi:hypothetical protein
MMKSGEPFGLSPRRPDSEAISSSMLDKKREGIFVWILPLGKTELVQVLCGYAERISHFFLV